MNNYWAFAPMTDSSPLLGDPDALQKRMDEDGYLLLRGLVDRDRLAAVHRDFLDILAAQGWIADGEALEEMRPVGPLVREGEDDFFAAYDRVQKLESFHTLAHDEAPVRRRARRRRHHGVPPPAQDRPARLSRRATRCPPPRTRTS